LAHNGPGTPIAIFEDCGQADGTRQFLTAANNKPRPDLMAVEHAITVPYRKPGTLDHTPREITAYLGTDNLGVAGNSNRAIKWFMEETGANHLMLCNDDLEFLGDAATTYSKAHDVTDVDLFCFCDFESPQFKCTPVRYRGTPLKKLSRMTGIMMSVTRRLVQSIGYFDPQFGKFGEEHSQPPGSLVLCGDYTYKPIESLKADDIVIGWNRRRNRRYSPPEESKWYSHDVHFTQDSLVKTRVMGTHKRRAPVVKITLDTGDSLLCTKDHKWLGGFHPDRGYITAEVGKRLIKSFTPISSPTDASSEEYILGYVCGALHGDGTREKGLLRVQCETFSNHFRRLASSLWRISTKTKVIDGKDLYHTRILGGRKIGQWLESWKPTSLNNWAGWLAGMYDAEGSNNSIGQSQSVNPTIYAHIKEGLTMFGFSFRETVQKHEILIDGGRDELIRFLNITRPINSSKADKVLLSGKFKKNRPTVVKVEDMGEMDVISLQTESGNYFGDGYASKNCDYTVRARYAGHQNLYGNQQYCLDVDHALIRHQTVASSINPEEKPELDHAASLAMARKSGKYPYTGGYLPFSMIRNSVVDAVNSVGTEVDLVSHYQTIV
jgi:hypothetical protein